MNANRRYLCVFLLASIMFVLLAFPALAAQESYVLKEGCAFRVKADGKEIKLEEDQPAYWSTDSGMYSWIIVDPELSDAMKGSKSGIYFFNELEEPLGFLPFEGAAYCNVSLSPDGEMITISFGTGVSQELILYSMDGFEKKKSFQIIGETCWLDPYRLVFTMDEAGKGARGNAMDQQEGWLSVMMYDAAMEELFSIVDATETEDYMLVGVNFEGEEIEVLKRSVKEANDWKDEQNIEDSTISIPIPAAG
ncbi:hypothetical protein Dpep_1354 [Dethiosulfovibrio peptidovorans DSM 11002]|uniref:Uncharacterized protein n=1 Tax=Dethiosulfovibrio peptidovorans DSM 11002 TaxID=469381 RepID=D2Z7D3_9BACT|nr:hypothetical protein [Dethiosulfovibrio peptidovorans]EFC91380.1 hypothetical protein Dpep_1354 [Dethiosulfovibrio peptidovorans DSM 11002]